MVLLTWARNGLLGPKGQGYQAIFEFPTACGITVGTTVRVCVWHARVKDACVHGRARA